MRVHPVQSIAGMPCRFLFSMALVALISGNHVSNAQQSELKRIEVTVRPDSDSVIAVPPAASLSFNTKGSQNHSAADVVDLIGWIRKKSAINGLESTSPPPWHVVVIYDQFDEDGDNVHSGTFEEYWVSPHKFKEVYKSDDFNQIRFASEKGLFLSGDQQWPDRTHLQVRDEVIAPFYFAAERENLRARNLTRSYGGHELQCTALEDWRINSSDPTQYCFEPNGSVLRYSRGLGWNQTVYNGIELFAGRNIAREVDVTQGGKPYLKLRVTTLESIADAAKLNFDPGPDAVGPVHRISGLALNPISTTYPRWPTSLAGQKFKVTVQVLVGKDGRVKSAQGISGPADGYKAAEEAAKKWTFPIYRVLDESVEIERTISFGVS